MVSVVTHGETETVALGESLGRLLRPGDFVALFGELGSGKTRFAQGVALGAGVDPKTRVTSPTYTIMNEYQGTFPLYHFDLYRLAGDTDIVELGFEDYFYGQGICLVEWAERLVSELPDEHLKVSFNYEVNDTRRIVFEWNGDRYREILQGLFPERKN
jgi:tRNA threonylcarbamoyladenosine biosynthesis protein TsaE